MDLTLTGFVHVLMAPFSLNTVAKRHPPDFFLLPRAMTQPPRPPLILAPAPIFKKLFQLVLEMSAFWQDTPSLASFSLSLGHSLPHRHQVLDRNSLLKVFVKFPNSCNKGRALYADSTARMASRV